MIMLDTGLTIGATITNAGLVTNIRVSNNPLTMATNAGTKILDHDADIYGFGVAKFDETSIANIMGFSHLAKQTRITYDNKCPGNEEENVFKVHTDGGIAEFRVNDEGLYVYEPSEKYLNHVREQKINEQNSLLISTVDENTKFHSQRQYERAKEARKIVPYHRTTIAGKFQAHPKAEDHQELSRDTCRRGHCGEKIWKGCGDFKRQEQEPEATASYLRHRGNSKRN